MALSSAICDVLWLQQLELELDISAHKKATVFCDNVSTIKLGESDAFRPRTKHIDIKFHYIRENVEKGAVELKYVPTEENAADALTKPVTKQKNDFCATKVGLTNLSGIDA